MHRKRTRCYNKGNGILAKWSKITSLVAIRHAETMYIIIIPGNTAELKLILLSVLMKLTLLIHYMYTKEFLDACHLFEASFEGILLGCFSFHSLAGNIQAIFGICAMSTYSSRLQETTYS